MEFLVFNRVGSPVAAMGPLTLSFSPISPHTTHSTTSLTNHPTISTSFLASRPVPPSPSRTDNPPSEQGHPPRAQPPAAPAAPVLTFRPGLAGRPASQPAASAATPQVRASSAGVLPTHSLFATQGPLPRPLRSDPAPQVGETTVLRRSPDWIVAAGQRVAGADYFPVPQDPYASPAPATDAPPSGWPQTAVRVVQNLLPGANLDHPVARGGRNPSDGELPMSVEAYVATAFPDFAWFRATIRRRGIHTPSPRVRVRHVPSQSSPLRKPRSRQEDRLGSRAASRRVGVPLGPRVRPLCGRGPVLFAVVWPLREVRRGRGS